MNAILKLDFSNMQFENIWIDTFEHKRIVDETYLQMKHLNILYKKFHTIFYLY